jgi:hypothetical protein
MGLLRLAFYPDEYLDRHHLRKLFEINRGCIIEAQPSPSVYLKAVHRQAALMAASMVSSLFIFVVVVELINRRPAPLNDPVLADNVDLVRYVFFAIAIVLVLVANVIRGYVLKNTTGDNVRQLAAKLNLVNVITLGLADAPAIMGLVLFIVWRRHTDFYTLGIISLYLMLRHFPRYRNWENFVAEKMGTDWTQG